METNKSLDAAKAEAIEGAITGKKWYLSKTFWANVIAGAAVLGQIHYGFVLPPEYQIFVLSGINVALRKITKEPVVW
jgi:hypothetical protein